MVFKTFSGLALALIFLSATAIRADVPTAGLVAHWPLNEGAGATAGDVSGNGRNGTISGAAWTTGQVGGALSFDGVNDIVTVGHHASLAFTAAQSYSVGAWVYVPALPSVYKAILSKSRDVAPWYGLWINTGNNWIYGSNAGGNIQGGPVTVGWHHIVLVQDAAAGQRIFYVDGANVGTGLPRDANGTGALTFRGRGGGFPR